MSKRNVVHIEIPAENSQAAGNFYEELFGWSKPSFANKYEIGRIF